MKKKSHIVIAPVCRVPDPTRRESEQARACPRFAAGAGGSFSSFGGPFHGSRSECSVIVCLESNVWLALGSRRPSFPN